MANGPNYIYDDQPIGVAGFGATADQTSITAPSPPEPQTWGGMASDVGRLGIGAVESQVGDIARYTGYPQIGEDWSKSGQAWTGSISPAGKQITEAPLFSGTTLQHPLSKGLMGAAKVGLWNLPALIPGVNVESMIARGAIGAGLGVSGAYGGIFESINSQPDDQLQKSSPTYMEIRKTHPEYEAKQILADQAWDSLSPVEKTAIVGTSALAGEAGPLSTVGKTISGAGGATVARLASGRLAQAGIGAAETGAVAAGQYVGTAIPTRGALASVGAPTETTGQIVTGAIEQGAVGAVIGAGGRIVRPIGGENVTGRETSKMGTEAGGTRIIEVPAGQPDPAEAQALQSAIGQRPQESQQAPPGPSRQYQRPQEPQQAPPGPSRQYQQPVSAPIPPRPSTPLYAPRQQPDLPLEHPPQVGQQTELPLQQPQRPQLPAPQQGELFGQTRQPVTQLGIPTIGRDVTLQPGETIARPPEAPKTPEPQVPTKTVAPVTKPIKPIPKKSDLTPEEQELAQKYGMSYVRLKRSIGEEPTKPPEGEPPTEPPPSKPSPPVTKVSEPEPAPTPTPAKGAISFEALKAKLKPTEAPTEAPTKAEIKRQATIAKLVGKKEAPTEVTRPTVEPTAEPKVTVLPSGMPAFTKIVPSEKAKAIVAKFAPKGEEIPKEPTPPVTKLKGFERLKQVIAAKAGEPEVKPTGKIAEAIKSILPAGVKTLPPRAAAFIAKGKVKSIEEAKKQVELNPTPAQVAAKNFRQGHPSVSETQGQPVTITSAIGKVGQAVGHILGTKDNIPGKHLDMIAYSPNDTKKFYVANEIDPKTSQFVRHVAITGANNANEAFRAHYGMNSDRLGVKAGDGKDIVNGIVRMSHDEFNHWKQTRNPEEPVYPSTEGKHPLDEIDVRRKDSVKTLGSMTVKIALEDALHRVPNTPEYSIYRKLADQVIKYIPDVPIYNLRQMDLEKIVGPHANAAYSPTLNQILMGTKSSHPDLTLLHEVMHAATMHLYNNNVRFKSFVDRVTQEYKQGISSLPSGVISQNVQLGGGRELLADIAKPEVQRQLAQMQMSDKLAQDLNMSTWSKATRTLWNGIVKSFKDGLESLGMKIPGKDDASKHTLLDGMLRLTDEAFINRSKLARSDFAKMYRAMDYHAEHTEITREQEHNSQQNITDTIHNGISSPDTAEDYYADRGRSVSERAEELLSKAPRGIGKQIYYEHIAKLMTTDVFRMANEKFFGKLDETNPLRQYVEKTLQRARDFEERLTMKREFVAQMAKATTELGKQETEKLSDVLSKSTAYRFDPRSPVGEGMNGWLKAAADRIAEARAKGEDDPNIFYKHQQALDKSDEIISNFNALQPAAKQWYGKLIDDYHQKGRERAEIATDALMHTIDSEERQSRPIPTSDPNDPASKDAIEYAKWFNKFEQDWDQNKAGLRQRILDDNLSDNEKQWLTDRGIDNVDDIHLLSVPKGPYVPLDHAGDYIINARFKIKPPEGAKQINDNTFEFKTPEAMKAFLKEQPPNSRPYVVHYNDKGEQAPKWEKWQNPDGSIGYARDNKAWRVEVNDKYYSGHDSLSAANRRFEELKATGAFTKISEPQMKQAGWYPQLEVSSPLFKKLISSVDKRTDYTDDQKAAVKELLTNTAISSMEGNRIAKTLLPRKLVAGWDTDFIKTYDKYADMHNALMSRNKYAKDMGAIHNDMIKYTKDNEFGPGATERSGVLSELHDRDNFFGSPTYIGGENTKFGKSISPALRKVAAASFLQNMASVGHLVTHSTHQIITADLVAAKYGGLGTMGEAARLHAILGGAGFRNAWRSLKETYNVITKDSKGLNYVESLMNKLDSHRYGAELRNLIDKAIETGRIHPDQGFDTSIYHMSSGKIDTVLSKLDRAARQTMGAIEAYNRVWGHALAYVRARENGENIEQATRSSFDMVSRSQGLLSRANMSPIMSKWYMRPAMQFRGWGMNMMMTIANSIYNGFKGETREVKVEAWKRLAYLFGTTAALTGVNGLPSDPMRIALALAGALGITNYNWSDAQNAVREKLSNMGGSDFANLAMDGIFGSLGPFSFYGADRVGFGSLLMYGEPKTTQQADLKAYAWDLATGAPGETVYRINRGVGEILAGDFADGISHLVPIKIIDDWAKAWKGATEGVPTTTGVSGMTPFSTGEAIMQGIGLTPMREQKYWEARTAEQRAEQRARDETSQVLDAVGKSKEGPERLRAMQQVSAYNSQHPEAPITPQDVMKALRRQTAPSMLGHTLTKRNRERLQQLEYSYGF